MTEIFGKIVGGLNKGVATVGANSKAMMEKAKINTAIGNLETQYSQLTSLLGAKVYEMYKNSGSINIDEGVASFFAELDQRVESINEQKEQLKRVEEELSMVTGTGRPAGQEGTACECGHVNLDGAKFCAGCGKQLA